MTKKLAVLFLAVGLVVGFGLGLAVDSKEEPKSEIAYRPGVGA